MRTVGPLHVTASLLGLITASTLSTACSRSPAAAEPAPVEVRAMPVVQRDAVVSIELVGDVRGSQQVDVRARVGGVITKKRFSDGAFVTEGQVLFTIDPREFLASRADARARLAEAQASLAQANQEVERYRPLVDANAIPKRTYDTAVTAAQQSAARVEALAAVVQQAELSLEYATVTAPLSGHIGEAQVFEGALVLPGQTLLATISRDDPAWVYFSPSENVLLDVERRVLQGGQAPPHTATMTLSDGTPYRHEGRINFSDGAVDPRTGTLTVRAEFPNPNRVLRPGMFVRTRVVTETRSRALLVPDVAVQEQLGRLFVMVVGDGDIAEQRAVTLGPRVKDQWVIEKGLSTGERVIVEGLQKVRAGTRVQPTAATAAASSARQPTNIAR